MRTQNLTAFILTLIMNFDNFLSKHSVSMKLLLIVELTIGNPIQFTELV